MFRLLQHQLAWFLPLTVLAYGLSAPHAPGTVAAFVAVLIAAIGLDAVAGPDRRAPADLPRWPFDLSLPGLALLHLCNLGLLLRMALLQVGPGDLLAGVVLTGASSGYTAIVLAHELIHRPARGHRLLGRLLLSTVLYEHFFTEHLRGHHLRVATPEDPATARYDERFWPFFRRTVPGQLTSAWALEARRTGPRWWRSRVLHGLLVGWGGLFTIGLLLGPVAALTWAGQAFIGVLLLEAVNYIEHWGLSRQGGRVRTVDSWDAESWFTCFALVGLSRHADHHAHPARPYPELRAFPDSPKLPWGYFATVIATLFANDLVRARLRAELERKGLGPFAREEDALAAR